jgi:hypothetical protein
MAESKTSPTTTSRPEDHPEIHPFELVGWTEEGEQVEWCPLCGALVQRDTLLNPAGTVVQDYLRLPDIAMEGYRDQSRG